MTTNQHTARVGFIGLGDQGAPMTRAIGDSGFELHAFSRTVAYMGPSGSGQVTKLLNNSMTMSNLDNAVDLIRWCPGWTWTCRRSSTSSPSAAAAAASCVPSAPT